MSPAPRAQRRLQLNFYIRPRYRRAYNGGQSLVEFALVLPLLLLLLAGGADLARAYFVGIQVSNAAREASLYVAGNAPYANGDYTAVLPTSGTYHGCLPGVGEGPAIAAGCASFAGSPLSCPSNEIIWTVSPTALPSTTGYAGNSFPVTVTATCNLDLLTPLLPTTVSISSTSSSWVLQGA